MMIQDILGARTQNDRQNFACPYQHPTHTLKTALVDAKGSCTVIWFDVRVRFCHHVNKQSMGMRIGDLKSKDSAI